MKYLYRKGYELRTSDYDLKWWQYIILFPIVNELLFYRKHFVDFIDDKGKITRTYVKND